ncbi:hypothetical protein H3S83_08955 [Bartonella sp. W8122]|uniref:P-loop NTPase fold protein n=1 Tax=Bartonella sp. W8122 TaxID=2750930 RepID=UPI0018DC84AE|nr:P-loop NTPase fold protein [Bartonella sp. W8122]MBI0001954.1 hypothetical protein [Bartonella sp. W8122]
MSQKILRDVPVSEDLFSGHGHKRTASALAKTIKEFGNDTCAIGLEGKWGAGKSTIIELARQELNGDKNEKKYRVFTFDLWSNQTSNFKRSFLEALLNWIKEPSNGLPNSEETKINKIYDSIRGKTINTRTTNHKIFNPFGIVFIIFALFLPLIYQWLGPTALKDEANHVIPILCMTSIVAIGVIFVCRVLYKRFNEKTKSWITTISEAITIFSRDAETTHEEKTIREQDPSQAEFYETFQNLLDIYQKENRRIVIVFDNIDRLTKSRLIDAWSEIRTVLNDNSKQGTQIQNIMVVVPYDKDHVLSAFASNNTSKEKQSTLPNDDIIRKSFDCVFHVSPPVLSDEAKFFKEKLHEAGDARYDYLADHLHEIFSLSIAEQTFAPTPRQIIHFINEVMILTDQWEKIPVLDVAVFVANAEKLYKNPLLLQNFDNIKLQYRVLADSNDLFRNLAALAYNVDPELAFQVLLYKDLENLFTKPKCDKLEELLKSPGIPEMLRKFIEEEVNNWIGFNKFEEFGNAVENLMLKEISDEVRKICNPYLINNLGLLSNFHLEDIEPVKKILSTVSLVENKKVEDVVQKINIWLKNSIAGYINSNREGHGNKSSLEVMKSGKAFGDLIGELHNKLQNKFETLENNDKADDLIKKFEWLGVLPELDIGVAVSCEETNLNLADLGFKPNEEICRRFVEMLDVASEDMSKALHQLFPYFKDDELITIIRSASKFITGKKADDVINNINIIAFILENRFIKNESLPQEFIRMVNSGLPLLVAYTNYQKDNVHPDYVAAALDIYIKVHPDLSVNQISTVGTQYGGLINEKQWIKEVKNDKEFLPEIIQKLGKFVNSQLLNTTLLKELIDGTDKEIFNVKVLTAVASSDEITPPDTRMFILNYAKLKEKLPENVIERFLAVVGQNLDSSIFQSLGLQDISPDLVKDILASKEKGWKEFLDWLDMQLKDTQQEEWAKYLSNQQDVIDIFSCTSKRRSKNKIGNSFAHLTNAVVSHCVDICVVDNHSTVNFNDLYGELTSGDKATVGMNFLEGLKEKTTTAGGIVKLWENCPQILEKLNWGHDKKTIVRRLIGTIITSSFIDRKQLVETLCEHLDEFVSKLDKDTFDEFKQRIDNAYVDLKEKNDEAGLAIIKQIAEQVGMQLGEKYRLKKPDNSEPGLNSELGSSHDEEK